MKLATYDDGSRDGHLVVVSRDAASAHYASGIATRLQQVLDDWNFLSPQLEELSVTLNHGRARHAFAFDARQCLAPLPRAYLRVFASVDVASDAPLLLPCSGSGLRGAFSASAEPGVAALAAVTGDVAMGAAPDSALEGVRLLMLGRAAGGGAAFAPLAVTPDELGAAWRAGRVHAALACHASGTKGEQRSLALAAMPWPFGELIATLAQRAPVAAGSIVMCGVGDTAPGSLTLELTGADGHSVFGALQAAAPS